MAQDKGMRVYQLAKTLSVESKDLLDFCKELGFDIKNQLSNLIPEQIEALTQRLKQGSRSQGPSLPVAATPAQLPTDISSRVKTLPTRVRTGRTAEESAEEVVEEVIETPLEVVEVAPPPPPPEPAKPAVLPTPAFNAGPPRNLTPQRLPNLSARPRPATPAAPPAASVPPPAPVTPAAPAAPPKPAAPTPPAVSAQAPPATPARPPVPPRPPAYQPGAPMRNLQGPPRPDGGPPRPGGVRTPMLRKPGASGPVAPRPAGTPSLRAPGSQIPGRNLASQAPAKPKESTGVKKLADIPKHLLEGNRPITAKDVLDAQKAGPPGSTPAPTAPTFDGEDEEGKGKGKGGSRVAPGGVAGRDQRRAQRDQRAKERQATTNNVQLQGGQVVLLEDERHRRSRRAKPLKPKKPGTVERKGKVPIRPPITVRSLSEAVGLTAPKVIGKLMELGLPFGSVNINSAIDVEMAELIATDAGVELEIVRQADAEELLAESLKTPDEPGNLEPRAPIVTIMGHVDHGKTSLLDRIREMYGVKSDVVSSEAGGITQVIRAWRVEKDGKPTTFLDTPGHEAFTKMRARGAQVTDIAVIVVAATDGVMPQTEEAISHAKAADVSIIVAINKTDMPNANLTKTRQQLYSLNILPDNMGGDVPFIETSAVTGKGIDELLEAIALVSELKELKANPGKAGQGTCLEAHLSTDEGVFATLLVREGTLRKGDIIICGHAYGRVRAMYNDLGRAITEAGPSVPVRITGLDDVPNADDSFQVVAELAQAREIAEKRKSRRQDSLTNFGMPIRNLDRLGEAKISELKVILKCDFRGSIEAIRKELEKFVHDEVRVRLLHAGIGAITVSDVQLALTSPHDTMVIGFNCVPDDEALRLAEERGVKIREYDIIYNLTADVKAALEGKLKPREEVIHLGRAVVRQTFKISRVGTIAGCYVTQGAIERSAKVRVIREGVVVYPPNDRVASLESLKHHKDDVREAKQGFECGIKVAGYDDVKVGDVVEAYRIEQVQRTL